MRKISEFHQHAAECRQLAKMAVSPDHAAMLENMARTWETLAGEREQHLARQRRIAGLDDTGERPA